MKKTLLLSAALLTGVAVNAQTHRKAPNTGPSLVIKSTNTQADLEPYFPSTNFQPTVNNTNKVQAPPYRRIGSSANAFTLLVSESTGLTYNKDINTVMFTHRKSPEWTFTTPAGANSGSIQSTWTSNGGTTWDSTITYVDATNLARYPSGVIYNPPANISPANAHTVVMGPVTTGTWSGNYYSHGTLTPGAINNSNQMYVAAGTVNTTNGNNIGGRGIAFSRIDLQETAGTIWGVANIYTGDPVGASGIARGYLGSSLIKASSTDGGTTMVWKSDSLKPNFFIGNDGAESTELGRAAFSPDGQTGYQLFIGVEAGATGIKKSYQPILYKTTDAGTTWTQVNAGYDWAANACLMATLIPTKYDSVPIIKPSFSSAYGSDLTVDNQGRLHYVCTVNSAWSSHIDSLGYIYSYNFTDFFPYMWDFVTSGNGTWTEYFIDSVSTKNLDGTQAENPWLTGSAKLAYDNRIQLSRTTDGSRIFVSWTDSDPTLTGTIYNSAPEIMVRGINATNMDMSAKTNMTAGQGNSYFHYMSNIVMEPGAGTFRIPFTYSLSHAGNFNADTEIDHFYVDDANLADAAINIPYAGCPFIGINESKGAIEAVAQNFPNPFDNNSTIKVTLKSAEDIKLSIYNTMGQMVNYKAVKGLLGDNNILVDATNLISGIYFYSINVNGNVITKKMTVQK